MAHLTLISAIKQNAQILLAILSGALILMWPAFLNHYPILYSDTNAFLIQGAEGRMIWDKPFGYGPFLVLASLKYSLWIACLIQALIVSYVLWLTQQALLPASRLRFVACCLVLAALSAAPWFTSLLMPDIFAPVTVLCLFLLAFDKKLSRFSQSALVLIATLAIVSHLTHLVIAAGCLIVIALIRFKCLKLAALPLLLAMGFLAMSNLLAYKQLAISPYGSVFMLARLATDGSAEKTLRLNCPEKNWHLCKWVGRLPDDSDGFMWNGDGPVWSHPEGATGLAPEASEIIKQTIRSEPLAVLQASLLNTWRQLVMLGLGDTLRPDWLDVSVVGGLTEFFPAREVAQYRASRQAAEQLAGDGTSLNPIHLIALIAGLTLTVYLMIKSWRSNDRNIAYLALMILTCIVLNAMATGALSKPHYRYQTRIVWLLLLVPLMAGSLRYRAQESKAVPGRANKSW